MSDDLDPADADAVAAFAERAMNTEPARVRAACESALAQAADPLARLRLQLPLGVALYRLAEYRQAARVLDAAVDAAARSGDARLRVRGLIALGTTLKQLGELDPALARLREAIALAETQGLHKFLEAALCNVGLLLEERGEHERALRQFRAAYRAGRQVRDVFATTLNNCGAAYGHLGDQRRALSFYQLALRRARATGHTVSEALSLANIGYASMRLGRHAEALQAIEASLAVSQPHGLRHEQMLSQLFAGETRLAMAEPATAVAPLLRADALAQALGHLPTRRRALDGLVAAHAALGDRAAAEAVGRARSEIERRARKLAADARTQSQLLGIELDRSQSELSALKRRTARLLRDRRRLARSNEALRRSLRAPRPAPAAAPSRLPLGIGELSEREVEVLRLLAQGQTNTRIAAALGLSPLTVRNYVTSLLGKLGVGTRTEAAALAVRSGLV
ncbi:MAG: LuxR C-terminal-related transcriptional regulator [Burkholderiaceae bacterium]|jgi:DNA-binding CsgD family transcriptional regulator|nr:LuxR C-terminal-related transcriptional regulator [Burkholderiaceae bacterium]